MPINPAIALQTQVPQQRSILDKAQQLFTLKDMQTRGKFNEAQLAGVQQQQADQSTARQILGAGGNEDETRQALAKAGLFDYIDKLDTMTAAELDWQVKNLDKRGKQVDEVVEAMENVFLEEDPQHRNELYMNVRRDLQRRGNPLAESLPGMFDETLLSQYVDLQTGVDVAKVEADTALTNARTAGVKADTAKPTKAGEYIDKTTGKKVFVYRNPDGSTFESSSEGQVGAAPRAPVPGTDEPFSPEVQAQRVETAQAGAGSTGGAIEAYAGALARGSMALTAVPTQVRSQVVAYMQANNMPIVTPGQAGEGRTAGKTAPVFEEIKALSIRINTRAGIAAYAAGKTRKGAAVFNYDDDVRLYEDLIKGFTPLVARSLGHTGVLTELDVESTRGIFPRPEDSKSVAEAKIKLVERIMSGVEDAILEGREITGLGKSGGRPSLDSFEGGGQ